MGNQHKTSQLQEMYTKIPTLSWLQLNGSTVEIIIVLSLIMVALEHFSTLDPTELMLGIT